MGAAATKLSSDLPSAQHVNHPCVVLAMVIALKTRVMHVVHAQSQDTSMAPDAITFTVNRLRRTPPCEQDCTAIS